MTTHTTRHICRKKHKKPCYWCGKHIVPGDKWTENVTFGDGEFNHMNMHEECAKAFDEEFQHYWPGSLLSVTPYANDRGQPAKEGTIYEV